MKTRNTPTSRRVGRSFARIILAAILLFSAPLLPPEASAQFVPDLDLQIESGHCADCGDRFIDFSWTGDNALDMSTGLDEDGWSLAEVPILTRLDGSRSARYIIPSGAAGERQAFFRARGIPQETSGQRLEEIKREDAEMQNDPPPFQEAGGPPIGIQPVLPIYPIRIRAVRTANDDGSQASTVTPTVVQLLVDQANSIYYSAGVEFQFDPAEDFETRHDTILNHDFTVTGDLTTLTDPNVTVPKSFYNIEINANAKVAVANEEPDAITVFFRWGDKFVYDAQLGHWRLSPATGGASATGAAFVNMPRSTWEKNLLAHEVGHYLNNIHPFRSDIRTVTQASEAILGALRKGLPVADGLTVLDSDSTWVRDTLPDLGGWIYQDYFGDDVDLGDPNLPDIPIPVVDAALGINEVYYFNLDHRHNIMSYFKHHYDLGHRNTPQMIERLRYAIENGNRHRLLGKKRPTAILQLQREGSVVAELIEEDFEIVRPRHGQVVTAVRMPSGQIRLIAWHIDDNGDITRAGSIDSGVDATELTAATLGLGHVATAFKNAAGYLEVIIWHVDKFGQITRKGGATGTLLPPLADVVVDSIATSRVSLRNLATAVEAVDGNIYLVIWGISADGSIRQNLTKELGPYQDVSVSPAGREVQLFTALTTSNGNLEVRAWKLQDGQIFETSARFGESATDVESAIMDIDLSTTLGRQPRGDLELINWKVSHAKVLTRRSSATFGSIGSGERTYDAARVGVDVLFVATATPANELVVDILRTDDAGVTVTNPARDKLGIASAVRVEQVGNNKVAVAARTPSGILQLRVWKVRELLVIP